MREYLISFFKNFDYEENDARQLILAYDTIVANKAAGKILKDALNAYEESIEIDYNKEILSRAKEIARISTVHPYTVDLLIFICMTKHLKEIYLEKSIDMQIYKDSVLDLKWKIEECKAVYGICGSFVAFWFPGFFNLSRFALGRLQFEIAVIDRDYEKNGVRLEKGKTKVLDVHIPRTGTPMDKKSCDEAYQQAKEFFKDQVGEICPFTCHSWLLYPKNKEILPAHTNTYRFMSEYEIVDWGYDEGQSLWRLFDTHEMNPDRLPTNGCLRRCYVEHLKKGGRVGWGYGIKI